MKWVVWYDDGSTFDSSQGPPEAAPRVGVLCITQASAEHGRVMWVGKDYFWWDEDGAWVNGDSTGLLDYLTRGGKEKIVLIGRGRPPDRFHAICKLALEDPRLPEKTSTDWLETTDS